MASPRASTSSVSLYTYSDARAVALTPSWRISGLASQSSASMMSAAVKGKTLTEVQALTKAFKAMMSIHEQTLPGEGTGKEQEGDSGLDDAEAEIPDGVKLGDLEALRGVVKFPVRIKCATLSWNTLAQGIEEATS